MIGRADRGEADPDPHQVRAPLPLVDSLRMCSSEVHTGGGGSGIRTHGDGLRHNGFQDRLLRPLGQPSRATIVPDTGVVAWVRAVTIGVAVVLALWLGLYLLARRLPPGVLRDVVGFLPDCATLTWRLRREPAVPARVRVAVLVAAVWVASPIDLIPEFLPVIGPLDDALVVALVLRYAIRRVPREVIELHWPGRSEVLDRLLGSAGG